MKCPLSRGGGEINQRIRAIQSGWTRQQPPLFLIEKKSPATLPILFDRPPSRVTLHGFGTERQMIDRIEIYSVEHIFASNRVSAAYSCWILQQALCTLGLNKVLGGCMKAKGILWHSVYVRLPSESPTFTFGRTVALTSSYFPSQGSLGNLIYPHLIPFPFPSCQVPSTYFCNAFALVPLSRSKSLQPPSFHPIDPRKS